MKIALDARKLFDGGIGTYIRELLSSFAREPEGDRFVALIDPRDRGRVRWPGPVEERVAAAGKYGLAEHWVVPGAARAAGAELLHAPHYTLPLLWSGPAVVTIHDLIHLEFPAFHPPGAAIYARAMAGVATARARVVLTDSEFTRQQVIERLGAPPSKVRVVHLAAPRGLVAPAQEMGARFRADRRLPAEYVLYVGARKRHKNLELLLRAWAALPAGARPPLVLSGEPWPREDRHARLARALGVERSLHFSGAIEDLAALSSLYAGAALYVQPSLAEGFGLPPLEAIACGVPVLSSDAGSLPEVLGAAAEFLPPRAPEAWAAAVSRLLEDSEARERLSARGRERVTHFSWERAARDTRSAYRDALAGA